MPETAADLVAKSVAPVLRSYWKPAATGQQQAFALAVTHKQGCMLA